MHPELTAQHTRLQSTSSSKRSGRYHGSQTKGEIYGELTGWLTPIPSPCYCDVWRVMCVYVRIGQCRGVERTGELPSVGWPDEGLSVPLPGPSQPYWRLIHCVIWTAGNGITSVEGSEDNTVTLDNGPPMSRNRTCQAISVSANRSCYPISFIHQLRQFPFVIPLYGV